MEINRNTQRQRKKRDGERQNQKTGEKETVRYKEGQGQTGKEGGERRGDNQEEFEAYKTFCPCNFVYFYYKIISRTFLHHHRNPFTSSIQKLLT